MAGKDARSVISKVFAAAGYQPHQIAGVLAHAERESGFNPTAIGDKGASKGLFQWQGPRLRALEQFAKENGGRPFDPEVQAQFAVHELQTSEKGAGDKLMNARDPREASLAMNRYERFSHNGGWKAGDKGESGERIKSAMRFAGDENTNVASKSSPFDQAAQSVTDYMNNSTPGKRLQADYINKTAPKPLEKEIAQAVAQNDQVASYVPKGPGNKVTYGDNNGAHVTDDADFHQAVDDITHPRHDPRLNPHIPETDDAPFDYPNKLKVDPEEDQSDPLVQQASIRIPRAEAKPPKINVARDAEDAARAADDGMPEAPQLLGQEKPRVSAQPKPPKPTTEEDMIRQILREEQLGEDVARQTGLDPQGNALSSENVLNPQPNAFSRAALIGGASAPAALLATDKSPNVGNNDPVVQEVQQKVGATPPAQPPVDPNWLLEALGDTVMPAVAHAAATDPTVAPAADTVAKSVVKSMAVRNAGGDQTNDGGYYQRLASQQGYTGDSPEMLRAVQMDQSGQQPPQNPMAMQTVPMPQSKPQDMPIDISSFINGGGFEVG